MTGVTAADVARLAGVSQSAVSRVFTPGASASAKTVKKVRQAAEELGYRPNSLARAMVSGQSKVIGLVVAYLDNQFYPDVIEKLSLRLQAEGYHLLLMMASETSGDTDELVDRLLGYQVDGIIAASVSMTSDLAQKCRQAGVPLIFFNRLSDDPYISSVTSTNYIGGKKVAEFLADAGYRKPGYIAGWEGASTQREREAGFRAGLAARGIELHARGVGDFDTSKACQAAVEMFAGKPAGDRPDAVFVANDAMAIAVMDVLRNELGLRIPEDIGVVGYDDVPAAAWASYDLTTIRQPANKMADATVELMLSAIESGGIEPRRVEIEGPLMIRGSIHRAEG